MAEIEPASDYLITSVEERARSENLPSVMPMPCHYMLAILARLRKAEADLARLEAAIDEAEKHGPEVVHFIRAMATQGGGNE